MSTTLTTNAFLAHVLDAAPPATRFIVGGPFVSSDRAIAIEGADACFVLVGESVARHLSVPNEPWEDDRHRAIVLAAYQRAFSNAPNPMK